MVSIIIPALNESAAIGALIHALGELTGDKEILVVDGESEDDTAALAALAGAHVVRSARGRGQQMSAGARAASGGVLWFVHADSRPSSQALAAIAEALRDERNVGGNFALVFAGDSAAALRMNWVYPKLRWLGLSYGDAGIFVRRTAYEAIGGLRPYGLFEDLDLVRRLSSRGRFVHLDCPLTTSSRRFEGQRSARVWTRWIALQALYWLGVSPNLLARWYRPAR